MATHRQYLSEVRAMRAELNKNFSIMTPYERQRIEAAIEAKTNQVRDFIAQGVKAEWAAALASHRAAQAAVTAANRREAARWDPARLGMEFQLARAAFDRSRTVKDAEREYNAALASGDSAKIRAFSETFSTALTKFTDDRLAAHRLAVDATRQAEKLTTTDEQIDAQARVVAAVDQVVGLRNDIGEVAQELGLFGLSREVAQVQIQTAHDPDQGTWSYSVVEPQAAMA